MATTDTAPEKSRTSKRIEKPLKLSADLVPEPLHYYNLRSEIVGIGSHRWRKLRASIIEERGSGCVICGNLESPHAHEVWRYIDKGKTGTAKLLNIEILCSRCHHIQHWGLTQKLALTSAMEQAATEELIKHFMKLNNCDRTEFDRHMRDSIRLWKRRNKLKWKVNWGEFAALVKEAHGGKFPTINIRAKPTNIKMPCRRCSHPITLTFPAGVAPNKKQLGILYACDACDDVATVELPPGSMRVRITKGALVLFSADSASPDWATQTRSFGIPLLSVNP